MKTAIRLDDITPDMDFVKFNKIRGVLDAARVKPLIGVVPYSRDENLRIEKPHEDFAQLLKELEDAGWLIALHGYNHLYTFHTFFLMNFAINLNSSLLIGLVL